MTFKSMVSVDDEVVDHEPYLEDLSTVAKKPFIYSPTDPPLCAECHENENIFFNPECKDCLSLVLNEDTSIAELFAVLRQWTAEAQQSLEILIREALKKGGHIDDRDGLTDMTLLHYACKAGAKGIGNIEEACRVVHLLITRGANVFISSKWTGMTALHCAAFFDIGPIVEILLKASNGIDIDVPCREFDDGTPLHIAALNLAEDAAIVLVQNGAYLDAQDKVGRTPLDCLPITDDEDLSPTSNKIRSMQSLLSGKGSSKLDSIHSSIVILQSLGLEIGDRVLVGGVKLGTLRYCGSTQFAPGIWAGIELDEAVGKNDGTVGGHNYFKCPKNYGIFAPVSKICNPKNPNATIHNSLKFPIDYGFIDTSHVTAKIDTGLKNRSPDRRISQNQEIEVGEKVLVAGERKGTVRYCGNTDFAPGIWYGIELERPVGKNDGSVNGRTYFTCKPRYGVFAPPSRVQRFDSDMNFLTSNALESKRRLSGGVNSTSTPNISSPFSRPKSASSSSSLKSVTSPVNQSELKLDVGRSVFCNNEMGTLRYIGKVEFSEGTWLGVEFKTPIGKNDGSVHGVRYFSCKPNYGIIVKPNKVSVRGISGSKLLGDSETS